MPQIGQLPCVSGVSQITAETGDVSHSTWLDIIALGPKGAPVKLTFFSTVLCPAEADYLRRVAAAINAVPLTVAPAEQEAA